MNGSTRETLRHWAVAFGLATVVTVIGLPAHGEPMTNDGRYQGNELQITRHRNFHDANGNIIGGRPAGCPRMYCGCGLARHLGLTDRSLWLASSWLRFPRTAPAPGRVAVWPGRHVALIEQVGPDGTAYLRDWNSGGGLTRLHWRSIRGTVVVDPSRMAAR